MSDDVPIPEAIVTLAAAVRAVYEVVALEPDDGSGGRAQAALDVAGRSAAAVMEWIDANGGFERDTVETAVQFLLAACVAEAELVIDRSRQQISRQTTDAAEEAARAIRELQDQLAALRARLDSSSKAD